jgi:hypothetical protein
MEVKENRKGSHIIKKQAAQLFAGIDQFLVNFVVLTYYKSYL